MAKVSSIIGRVKPTDTVIGIIAINGKDSIKTAPAACGEFSLNAKAGSWKVIVDAKEPYKDVVLNNVQMPENSNADVGEILLTQ